MISSIFDKVDGEVSGKERLNHLALGHASNIIFHLLVVSIPVAPR
jgi:hypothetical protein